MPLRRTRDPHGCQVAVTTGTHGCHPGDLDEGEQGIVGTGEIQDGISGCQVEGGPEIALLGLGGAAAGDEQARGEARADEMDAACFECRRVNPILPAVAAHGVGAGVLVHAGDNDQPECGEGSDRAAGTTEVAATDAADVGDHAQAKAEAPTGPVENAEPVDGAPGGGQGGRTLGQFIDDDELTGRPEFRVGVSNQPGNRPVGLVFLERVEQIVSVRCHGVLRRSGMYRGYRAGR